MHNELLSLWSGSIRFFHADPVLRIIHRLQPFVGAVCSRYFHRKMGKPAVRRCAVPVLDSCRNLDAVSGLHLNRILPPFLIISPSGNADQDLSAAFFGMMSMPVIPALNWTTPSQSPGFTGLNAIQNCIFCTLFDEVLLLSIFPFLQHPILLLPD